MSTVAARAISLTESGLIPDAVVRKGIQKLLQNKRREIRAWDIEHASHRSNAFVAEMLKSPVALVPELANEQHYEVPAEFFAEVLGEYRKYSCCYWDANTESLHDAELAALQSTLERAGVADGQSVLDLGCGWGSVSLYIAQQYPNCRVTSVSNSASQREYIAGEARRRGLDNIDVITADMNDFTTSRRFDRVISVEMFEHMRNYAELLRRIDQWLQPDGRFFMHIFTHRTTPYAFVDNGPGDWMSRHFFSGGMMPSAGLPLRFADHLVVEKRWSWNGNHYAKTCRAWLQRMDGRRESIMPILADTYGATEVDQWWRRWRMFFMACEELFRYGDGSEWFVSHYLFRKRNLQ